jgi:hypothetical protein
VGAAGAEILVIRFKASEPAFFALNGDGSSPIGIEVIDAAGRTLCNQQQPSEAQECHWRPERDGQYEVKVSNKGRLASSYTFFHN